MFCEKNVYLYFNWRKSLGRGGGHRFVMNLRNLYSFCVTKGKGDLRYFEHAPFCWKFEFSRELGTWKFDLPLFFKGGTKCRKSKHSSHPRLTLCTQNFTNANSRELTFVEFCVDGINLFVENNFIDSLGW